MHTSETIKDMVDSYLCTQCGTCVAVCPVNAIFMKETPAGLLFPSVISDDCISCGECRRFCPAASLDLDLPAHIDPFKGEVRAAFIGHASDESIRARGQSGGIATALLLFLIEVNAIDAAMVTTMPKDGTLRAKPVLARSKSEILASQGSKYCPAAPNSVLAGMPSDARIAAVGVSCQMHAFHKLEQHGHSMARSIQLRIGLVCDRTLLYACIDQMAADAGLSRNDILGIEYRSKARNGWPGEVCFHTRSGDELFFPSSLRKRLKDAFTPPRCRLCFDKMNILGDITVGDAWGISESYLGDSIIIARTLKGVSLLKDAQSCGLLNLKEVSPDVVFDAQKINERRKYYSSFIKACQKMALPYPQLCNFGDRWLYPGDSKTDKLCTKRLSFNYGMSAVKSRIDALNMVSEQVNLTREHSHRLKFISRYWHQAISSLKGLGRR